jgi:hypothetical protein
MNIRAAAVVAALACASAGPALARDTVLMIPLAEVLEMPEAKEKLDGSVAFYLAGQPIPNVLQKMSEDVANHKTNGVGKEDHFGCKWVAVSALYALQESAKRNGANAVIDIVSYYKKNTRSDPTSLECHAGNIVIGLALKGTYAKVAK